MGRAWFGVAVMVLLTGCDQAPAIRQNLAQCQLSPEAHRKSGAWDDSYLAICMQARGYRLDTSRSNNARCDALPYPAIVEACYRRDNWISNFFGELAT
jgi:hypothetical protein